MIVGRYVFSAILVHGKSAVVVYLRLNFEFHAAIFCHDCAVYTSSVWSAI